MNKFWVSTGTEFLSFQTRVFRLYQRFILMLPGFLEMNSGTERICAFLHVWRYLRMARVPGDYLEFGVFEGLTFELALRSAGKYYDQKGSNAPRFFAFDSFSGLPSPDPSRDSDFFRKGEYSSSLEKFKKNIFRAARGWDVRIIPGFYKDTLHNEMTTQHELRAAAFINIDCDLYDSTLTVLRFVTPLLQNGTMLYFDDWYFSRGNRTMGELGACNHWLAENPRISLVEYDNVGTMGMLFIVSLSTDPERQS